MALVTPNRMDAFVERASALLPGVLYSFNIADFKRRNAHLGHTEGDTVIAMLEQLFRDLTPPDACVSRVGGDRWLMFTRGGDGAVAQILERFARTEPFVSGWEMRATKDSEQRTGRGTVVAELRLALRCLRAEVDSPEQLLVAIAGVTKSDYSLPVSRPITLAAEMKHERWQSVSDYPDAGPVCPFCGEHRVNWTDGDGGIYSGDGKCVGCGASLSLHDVSARLGAPG